MKDGTKRIIFLISAFLIASVFAATTAFDIITLNVAKFVDLGYIADANGNELIILDTVASAVNEVTLANAATGNAPVLKATGGDTNVGLSLQTKGSGTITLQATTGTVVADMSSVTIARLGVKGSSNTGISLYEGGAEHWAFFSNGGTFGLYDVSSLAQAFSVSGITQITNFDVGPTAPTAAASTNTTQLATTAFVKSVPIANANTGTVTANAADTYITGSSMAIGGRVQAKSILKWRFAFTKTAAGTATPVFTVRFGTAGTTSDTARLTFTGIAQTAATDTGFVELEAVVLTHSATGTVNGVFKMAHTNATTGISTVAQDQLFEATSGTFDTTGATLIAGVSCNPGASGVWTFTHVSAVSFNLN
jgi:hypothetical protein